jgi:hypothetical protein
VKIVLIDSHTGEETDITDCILPMETAMNCFDHFPWDSATDPARLATIHDALALVNVLEPVVPLPTPRFVLRYGVYVCSVCGMAKEYCRGHTPAPPVQGDGDASDLERRARDSKRR